MDNVLEQDEEIRIRLEWPVIVRLAVKAACLGCSFNELVVRAVEERVTRERTRS